MRKVNPKHDCSQPLVLGTKQLVLGHELPMHNTSGKVKLC
jgi:hypothetical protein